MYRCYYILIPPKMLPVKHIGDTVVRMKTIAATALFLMMFGAPQDYPLRLKILHVEEVKNLRWGYVNGHGVANIREEDGTLHGIDFEFEDCDHGFKAAVGPLFYPARLRKPFHLEVASQEIGSDKVDKCDVKFTPRDFMYVYKGGKLGTQPAKNVPLGAAGVSE